MHERYEEYVSQVEEAVGFLQSRIPFAPEVIIVLGTGLGGLCDHIEDAQHFPYETIPHFPAATVESHAGNLILGTLGGRRVAVLQGRFHFYEGYAARQVTFPVRVLSRLGPKVMIITNAAGGLNPAMAPGSLMILTDHLNLIPDNPLRGPNNPTWGPRFPDMSQVYDSDLKEKAILSAAELGLSNVTTGTYVAIPGPSLETPAETRYLRNCGADAVGMSTVPEVIVARHAGLKVLGISVVANVNDPDNLQPILLDDIIEEAKRVAASLEELVIQVLQVLDRTLPPADTLPETQMA